MFAVAATAILLLSACNGDDDATPSTVTAETSPPLPTIPPELTTSTTDVPTTTTASTTTPSTTSQPTSDPSTTSIPTTTSLGIVIIDTDPGSPEVREMLADFEVFFDAFNEMTRNPTDDAAVAAAKAASVGDMLETIDRTVALLDQRNQISIENPENPTRVEVVTESITLLDDGAGFDACLISTDRLADRNQTEPPVALTTSRSVTYALARFDGRWLVDNIQFFTEFEGQEGCGS